jgi:hypothetical protein
MQRWYDKRFINYINGINRIRFYCIRNLIFWWIKIKIKLKHVWFIIENLIRKLKNSRIIIKNSAIKSLKLRILKFD